MAVNILDDTKLALRITTTEFDPEISDIIEAGIGDLGLAGVDELDLSDPLVKRAIITYAKVNFGQPDDAIRLKAAYDEQKAQLKASSDHHVWEG